MVDEAAESPEAIRLRGPEIVDRNELRDISVAGLFAGLAKVQISWYRWDGARRTDRVPCAMTSGESET